MKTEGDKENKPSLPNFSCLWESCKFEANKGKVKELTDHMKAEHDINTGECGLICISACDVNAISSA